MKIMPEFPLVTYLTKKGLIGFDQDLSNIDSLKSKNVDVWVVNNHAQFEEIQRCHRIFLENNSLNKVTVAKTVSIARGTQIVHIPNHLFDNPDIKNKEIQFGFVTSHKAGGIFCRYYSTYDLTTLRTLSCSERSSVENTFLLDTMKPEIVKYWLKYIAEEDKKYKAIKEEPWIRLSR
jgi:hypothetical protein